MFKKIAVIISLYVAIFTSAISGQSNKVVAESPNQDFEK